MGQVDPFLPPPDPEAICTRVVARVIEELSCIDVAPDSPAWTELTREGARVGQLALYRGRSGIERMVTFDVTVPTLHLQAHYVAVMTEPQSLVPHLLLRTLSRGDQTDLWVDLMPRVNLHEPAYVQCCYAPLAEAHGRARQQPGFHAPEDSSEELTPWAARFHEPSAQLGEAARCVSHYTDHWARLMCQGAPYAVQQAATGTDLQAFCRTLRARRFRREADPVWGALSSALGEIPVDGLLSALRGD